jgi:hypothetical protein
MNATERIGARGMVLMRKNVFLMTNNPCFQQTLDSSHIKFLDGTSLDVLIAARDAIHMGSVLLTHPLYGNLRPNQQPFRSVLLQNPASPKERNFSSVSYLESISTIEESVLLYRGYAGRLPAPESLPHAAREDYAFIDSELMRESLTLYGMFARGEVKKNAD